MKTIGYAAKCYALDHSLVGGESIPFEAFKGGANFTQYFVPLEEEKPPYEEDILIQTHRGSIYFGKMKDGLSGRPDFLRIDCSEDTVSIKNIKSWRPIFYK